MTLLPPEEEGEDEELPDEFAAAGDDELELDCDDVLFPDDEAVPQPAKSIKAALTDRPIPTIFRFTPLPPVECKSNENAQLFTNFKLYGIKIQRSKTIVNIFF